MRGGQTEKPEAMFVGGEGHSERYRKDDFREDEQPKLPAIGPEFIAGG
jgi:hypothetical protein